MRGESKKYEDNFKSIQVGKIPLLAKESEKNQKLNI